MFSWQIWCLFIGTGCAIFHDAAASECVTREEFESRLLELTESHKEEIRKLKDVNEALERRVENLETQRIQNNEAAIKNEKETNDDDDDYEEVFVKNDEENLSDYKDLSNDSAAPKERMEIITKLPLSDKTSTGTAEKLRKISQKSVNEKNIHSRYLVNEAAGVPVAFSLLLNSSVLMNLGTNQIIKFNKIVTNIDDVYDMRLGVFTAPISGYYAISLAMMTRPNETQMLYVMKDGIKMFHVYATGTFFNTATKTMVIQVNKGQEVWVQTTEDPGFSHNLHGFDHAAFTGFLLYASDI